MTMLLLSIPAMVNGHIGLGWLENLKKFPPAYINILLELDRLLGNALPEGKR